MNQPPRPWWPRFRAWPPPLEHPLALATLIILVARSLGLALHYFGRDLGGQPLVVMPMTLFPAAFAYHCAALLSLALGLLLLWKLVPGLRRATLVLALLAFGVALLLGEVDFEMLRLVGRRFSPSVFSTYVPHDAFTSEIILPLRADLAHTLFTLGLIFAGWLALVIVVWRGLRASTTPRWSWPWVGALAAICGYAALVPARYTPSSRALLQPPEVTFLRAWSSDDRTPAPVQPEKLAAVLRSTLVPAAATLNWTGERYPLIHSPGTAATGAPSVADPPDIIVIAVESLHAPLLGYINPAQRNVTPMLDALARESVVFSHFIANGYPSAPGFFAINTGTLPHRTKTVTAEFPDRTFDALPIRLKDFGYHRLAIWGGNAAMANELAWAQRWYDEVDYQIEGNQLEFHHSRGDAETFRALTEHIAAADRAHPGQPQFVFVATAGTHGPFTATKSVFSRPEDRAEAAPFTADADEDREDNYDQMLHLLDRQVGKLAEFLATRARSHNTVLVICGDHSVSLTGQYSYDIRSFPVDGVVWTSALFHGDARLVGPPRVETFPSSQADLMPTLLALAGDRRPTSAMGADLLAPLPPAQRFAIAVREDGYRLDRDGWSLFVSAADPADFFVHRSFQLTPRSRASDPGGPFKAQDARDLHAAVHGWSWLIEQNRVWPTGAPPP
jgi:phosphoglycerol transferase MdoB-like AlkP superfamily enzyme